MNIAEHVLPLVQKYTGDNLWQDVLFSAAEEAGGSVDEEASEDADRYGRGTAVVFSDGSSLEYLEDSQRWALGA